MSRPGIKISKRCSSCGAALRRKDRFCRQCGSDLVQIATKPLDERKSAETQSDDAEELSKEVVNDVNESETMQTVSLETVQIISTIEVEEEAATVLGDSATRAQNHTADVASVWANFERNEDEDEAEEWNETSPTVALTPDTVALVEPNESAEYQTESLSEDSNAELPEDETLETTPEIVSDENKITAAEKSQVFVERAGDKRSRMKRMVAKSKMALDQSSPDPSLRFTIISVVIFLLALVLFLFSRVLK